MEVRIDCNPKSKIQNPKSPLGGNKWLDIEMRCAGYAAVKVESYS
jgi:hypothetical protein